MTDHWIRANRFHTNKATSSPPSLVRLIYSSDWLAIDLEGMGDCRRKIKLREFVTYRIALQEAGKALAIVTIHCHRSPDEHPIHDSAILYLHACEANALRSSLPDHCVSGCVSCDPTIMPPHPSTNDGASSAFWQYRLCAIDGIR